MQMLHLPDFAGGMPGPSGCEHRACAITPGVLACEVQHAADDRVAVTGHPMERTRLASSTVEHRWRVTTPKPTLAGDSGHPSCWANTCSG